MKKLYDLTVKTGSYTNKAGEDKGRYINIGSVMENDKGKFIIFHKTRKALSCQCSSHWKKTVMQNRNRQYLSSMQSRTIRSAMIYRSEWNRYGGQNLFRYVD